jgi:hypothetical protein
MLSGTMSRSEKGRIATAPNLGGNAQLVVERVALMVNVSVQAHWEIGSQTDINGTDFYVGEQELGHIHLDGEAHIPIGATIVNALVKTKIARRFRWSKEFAVIDTTDVDATVWLFALRHSQIAGAIDEQLLTAIKHYCEL